MKELAIPTQLVEIAHDQLLEKFLNELDDAYFEDLLKEQRENGY